ncbi:putative glycosyltransferase EpsJ [Lachnospiraceae bacterium]|jgi:glycosyltransferase involved in cell wall biosynthesis|nr:putative glycosyltransferase EpsJ [Lachnospiraceae bacterium]
MEDKYIPDISVIVIVYNIEKYIGECLECILSQEGPSLECICIDDASTDESYLVLEKYAKKDKRIKIIRNEKNMGQSSSRNKGFRYATGEYLYCIDGDDFLVSGTLKRLYSCAKENHLDLLGFSANSFFEDDDMRRFGEEGEYDRKGSYLDVKRGVEVFGDLITNGDRVNANIVLYFYRRDYFEANNLYAVEELRYADDSMFAMYMAAKRVMCIPDRLYMRRYRQGSTCTSAMKKCYLESLIVLFLHELQVWDSYNFDTLLNEKIERYFNNRLIEIKGFFKIFQNDSSDTPLLNKYKMAKYFYKYFIGDEPLCKKCLTKEELQRVKEADTVILYGAGFIAGEVAKTLEYNGIEDYNVVVTDRGKEHARFRGKEIFSINELECQKENSVVVVAMSQKNYNMIMETLNMLEYRDICWASL